MIERRPLCPPSPPPRLSRTDGEGDVELVVHDDEVLDGQLVVVEQAADRARRTRSCRSAGGPGRPGGRPAGPRRRPRASGRPCPARAGCRPGRRARRAPSRRRCAGCPAYPGPGLPSPTTRNGPSDIGGGTPRGRRQCRRPRGSCCRSADASVVRGLLGRVHRLAAALVLRLRDDVAVGVGLLALDAGLGLGLVQLGLERLGGRGAEEADDQRLGVGDQRRAARAGRGRRR